MSLKTGLDRDLDIKNANRRWRRMFSESIDSVAILQDGPSRAIGVSVPTLELRIQMMQAFDALTPIETRILQLLHGLDGEAKTHKQVADMFRLTVNRLKAIEKQALTKLRNSGPIQELFNS